MKTTSTAANLDIALTITILDISGCTHAAVEAAISNLRALVKQVSVKANTIVKPAMASRRPPSVFMKYNATIAAIGSAAETTLIKMLLNLSRPLSL